MGRDGGVAGDRPAHRRTPVDAYQCTTGPSPTKEGGTVIWILGDFQLPLLGLPAPAAPYLPVRRQE